MPLKHVFRYHGKRFALFKRPGSPSWYIHIKHRGRRYKRSLSAVDVGLATSRAKEFIDSVYAGRVEKRKLREPATVADVMRLYQAHAVIAPRTAKNNALALAQIVRTVLGLKPGQCNLDMLDARVVRDFQAAFIRRYVAEVKSQAEVRDAKERALRSSRSLIQQARSLFAPSRGWPDLYASHGIELPPSISSFMSCPLQGRIAHSSYSPPADSIIQKTIARFSKRPGKTTLDIDAYLGFWFALGAGLRRGEIAALRWENIVMRSGQPWVVGGIGKDGEVIEVPIQSQCWQAIAPCAKKNGLVLSTRSDRWAHSIAKTMGELGWKTRKRLHELRAYIGSLIYAESPVSAMRFLRHKSIRTTEQFYVRYHSAASVPDVALGIPEPIGAGRPR